MIERLSLGAREPRDIASLALYRIVFGLLMFAAVVRWFAYGWIHDFYIAPSFHFTYIGMEWIAPLPEPAMYGLFAALGVLALAIAAGFLYRLSATLFWLGFTYVELIDQTTYLNHYYLVSLVVGMMIFMPLHRAWSIDAWLRPALRCDRVPAWCLTALRVQVGLVYFYAGVAKLHPDWLLDAQPLTIWLSANSDLSLLGLPLGAHLSEPWVPYAASWMGALFDLTIVGWLLWPRSRPYAFVAAVIFHLATVKLFYLGLFPWLMIANATLFFRPDWPRRLTRSVLARWRERPVAAAATEPGPPVRRPSPWARVGLAILTLHLAAQLVLPLRHVLYPGDVCWTEEGFAFSWRVMLVEKAGYVRFYVSDPNSGRTSLVYPTEYLVPRQARMMATQPDMILQLAHHIAADYRARGHDRVEVRVEAYVSWNGRPSVPLVDEQVDLAVQRRGLQAYSWIAPSPDAQLAPPGDRRADRR